MREFDKDVENYTEWKWVVSKYHIFGLKIVRYLCCMSIQPLTSFDVKYCIHFTTPVAQNRPKCYTHRYFKNK
jgi:hypothetical protein